MSDSFRSHLPAVPHDVRQDVSNAGAEGEFWTAFRYLLDELPADETGAFEERLAVDQGAREMLAEAVRLRDTIAAGAPSSVEVPVFAATSAAASVEVGLSPVVPAALAAAVAGSPTAGSLGDAARRERPAVPFWSSAGWFAFAAACLALFAVLSRPFVPGETTPVGAPIDEQLLAALVIDGAEGSAADEFSSEGASHWVAAVPASTDEDDGVSEPYAPLAGMEESAAPDWLIAAVVESNTGVPE